MGQQRGRVRKAGNRIKRRIGDKELAFYENIIGAALSGILNLNNLANISDDPEVLELAIKVLRNLQSIRKLTIDRMIARKEAVIDNESKGDFGGNGQPPAA